MVMVMGKRTDDHKHRLQRESRRQAGRRERRRVDAVLREVPPEELDEVALPEQNALGQWKVEV